MTRWHEDGPRALSAATFRSVADLWHHRVGSTPDGEAITYRTSSGWATLSWRQMDRRVESLANALLAFGLEDEQRACLLSLTRLEWILADLAILNAGGATTTIYPSSTPTDVAYIVADSNAVLVFAENDDQVAKLLAVRDRLPEVRKVVVFDGTPSDDGWVETLAVFEAAGRAFANDEPEAYTRAHTAIEPDRIATLIYTSGTTGPPKGVMLTHDAWVYEAEAMDLLGVMSPADKQLLFLPLAHVFAKVLQLAFIRLGMPTVVDGDSKTLFDTLRTQSPTWMAGVPRVFEKAHDAILADVARGNLVKRKVFDWALQVGQEMSEARLDGRRPGTRLRARHAIAHRLVFARIHERFGGRLRFFISGGAPLNPELARFFHALGVLVLEGWGLTESGGASTVNTPDDVVFGTVGRPMPGCQIRIEADGEILLRSRGVMRGYHNAPEETARVLTDDGWLRTGDIGDQLVSGHIRITDRKKDLIITAGGKNVAPANVQGLLNARCPYVEDVILIGDRRPYCVALLTLNLEGCRAWARAEGLTCHTYDDFHGLSALRALIQAHVDEVNATLPRYETVKAFRILPETLSLESGTLTPSLKVRRQVVEERYADVIDSLYADPRPPSDERRR
jgi:long-chain acyl-CoA synthetase